MLLDVLAKALAVATRRGNVPCRPFCDFARCPLFGRYRGAKRTRVTQVKIDVHDPGCKKTRFAGLTETPTQ